MNRILALLVLCLYGTLGHAQVLTESYDNSRTGANLSETILNTSNVNVNQFGKLFSTPIDGSVYAMPLYVPGLVINGAVHNVLYVATMNDVVYAFDADTVQAPLWVNDFRTTGTLSIDSPTDNIAGNIGIEGTPVIDLGSGAIYLVSYGSDLGIHEFKLHALDLVTGLEKFGGPVTISASLAGTGPGSVNGVLGFDATVQNQRPGLALANGQVFISWASFGDSGNYHGWILSYDELTLHQDTVFCTTPNGSEGGFWMSGRAPVVDSNNYVYFLSANGDFDGISSFSDSFLKFSTSSTGFSLYDWFTPDNFTQLSQNDQDLGSSGAIKIPNTSLMIGGGKGKVFYVVNAQNLGKEWMGNAQIIQSWATPHGIYTSPVFYSNGLGGTLYVWYSGGYLTAYSFSGSLFNTTPTQQGTYTSEVSSYGGALAVTPGIVWASIPDLMGEDQGGTVPGVLRAFDANDLTKELWNSDMNKARDASGIWSKFRTPLIVNGKAYMLGMTDHGAGASLSVYGLLNVQPPPGPLAPTNLIAVVNQ